MIAPSLDTTLPTHYKNLIVGGCSFSHNGSAEYSVSWPYFLRDRLGIDNIVNCVLPGAGNEFISTSVQWLLETRTYDPADTLVVIMWSGNNRDNSIVDPQALDPDYPHSYYYDKLAAAAVINYADNWGNINIKSPVKRNNTCRAIANYLHISGLYYYLQARQYPAIHLDFLDRSLPNRANDVEIRDYLPNKTIQHLDSVFAPVETIYSYCLKHNQLSDDDFHPSPEGHLAWVDNCLIPYLKNSGAIAIYNHLDSAKRSRSTPEF